jgi:hypothetical protein
MTKISHSKIIKIYENLSQTIVYEGINAKEKFENFRGLYKATRVTFIESTDNSFTVEIKENRQFKESKIIKYLLI